MHHLILGYGYCGYYLAKELLKNKQQVTTVSRHIDQEKRLPKATHLIHDLNQPLHWTEANTIMYYLIPPPPFGENDALLSQFLHHNPIPAKKFIYFGSSGVYGNHQGAWVNEESTCFVQITRQQRRLDAEQQCLHYCTDQGIQPILLRIAGIYGPDRLPIAAAKAKTPIIDPATAPLINHIYVKDLAAIAYLLSKTDNTHFLYNVADDNPQPMGSLQQSVAKALGLPPAPYQSNEKRIYARIKKTRYRTFTHSIERLIEINSAGGCVVMWVHNND